MSDYARFVEWYASLAPEGETALVLRQKPIRPPAFHADGSPKCTYIPLLPSARVDPSWSVFGNTGSFIIDRFPEGRPVAQARCVEYPLVLMLDDVGTKSRVPPVPPTWIIESSPDNYQYGYAFTEDGVPTGAQFVATVKNLAELGYTDPGAGGLVRNFRLPGSINLKRNGFAARLVEFHPERQYSYLALCDAFGIAPASPDVDARTSWSPVAGLADDGADDVWSWLLEQGLVASRPNAEGWAAVMCPNAHEHTDGNPEGRYSPANRAYCCLHGHCVDLDSRTFLDWVASQGGPKREPGLREELLAATMAAALAKLPQDAPMAEAAAEALASVQAREHGRIERDDLHRHWAYVVSDDGYFNLDDRTEVSRAAFNALYAGLSCRSRHGKNPVASASKWFDEWRHERGGKALSAITYAPGLLALVERDGDVLGNRWQDARTPLVAGAGSAGMWLAHLEALLPEAAEREALLDVLAFKLQHPDVKVNHGVLLAGHAGCGKDSLMAPFIRAVCGPHQRNRGLVQGDELSGQFGYHLECEVLVLNELRDSDAGARRALANKLKPLLAAPPEYLSVNRKGLRPYDAINRMLVVAYSNEQVPLVIDSSDRRWLALKCSGGRMDPADAELLWSWYESGGYDAVAALLWSRDVSAFNAGAAPMRTRYWESLVLGGRSPAEELLIDMIQNRVGEFARGVIGAPFSALCSRIQAGDASGLKVPKAALLHALAECGWVDCGAVASREHPTKKQVYCAPQLADYSKSDLRRMVEPDATVPGLRAVTG